MLSPDDIAQVQQIIRAQLKYPADPITTRTLKDIIGPTIRLSFTNPALYTPVGDTDMVIFFNSVNYYLYIWANKTWTSQQLGISSSTPIVASGPGTNTTVAASFTPTKIPIASATIADGITYDSTNHRFTIVTAGYYLITGFVFFPSPSESGKSYQTMVYVNGSSLVISYQIPPVTSIAVAVPAIQIAGLSAGDYIELFSQTGSSSTQSVTGAISYLSLTKV